MLGEKLVLFGKWRKGIKKKSLRFIYDIENKDSLGIVHKIQKISKFVKNRSFFSIFLVAGPSQKISPAFLYFIFFGHAAIVRMFRSTFVKNAILTAWIL